MCGLISCQPPSTNGASSAARARFRQPNAPVRDLSQDEAAGGHILRKHVGQTDERTARASGRRNATSPARRLTRTAPPLSTRVGAAIAQSQGRIQRWLNRSGGHPNLVLDYDSEDPIGRTMNRGENQSHPCTHALVVLKIRRARPLLRFDFLSGVPLMKLETGNYRRQLSRAAYFPAGLLSRGCRRRVRNASGSGRSVLRRRRNRRAHSSCAGVAAGRRTDRNAARPSECSIEETGQRDSVD